MAIMNAWLFYKREATNLGIQENKQLSLSDFKMQVAFSLIKTKKDTLKRKRRPSSSFVEPEYKKKKCSGRKATNPIPQKDIRLDLVGHFPAMSDNRATCKLPGCSGKILMFCMKCEVHLCCSKSRNCFYDFHSE